MKITFVKSSILGLFALFLLELHKLVKLKRREG